jgi:hypothetical protein
MAVYPDQFWEYSVFRGLLMALPPGDGAGIITLAAGDDAGISGLECGELPGIFG